MKKIFKNKKREILYFIVIFAASSIVDILNLKFWAGFIVYAIMTLGFQAIWEQIHEKKDN